MERFYRVLPTLPGLAGLFVKGDTIADAGLGTIIRVAVTEIITNAVIGDRDVKYPIPGGSLYIGIDYLEEVQDPTKEYSTKSPFGVHFRDGTIEADDIHIAYTVFSNAVTITIYEIQHDKSQKTLFSQNFFHNRDDALEVLADVAAGVTPVDDLALILQDI